MERIQILANKEQTFSFPVDSKPLLVGFDYRGTLIKEVEFYKTTDELAYQAAQDEDVLGRAWALGQLAGRLNQTATAEVEKERITKELATAVVRDKFWGMRVEAATALADAKGVAARGALIAATRDADARVRARAVNSLARSKDASLADLYQSLLADRSYAVIKAAASALGDTGSPDAYQSLTKLLQASSWRDNIRASALTGLRGLKDKRSLDVAFRYAVPGNHGQVRAEALRLLGVIGADDPKAFEFIADIAKKAFERGDINLATASGEALVSLGDSRGVAVLDEIGRGSSITETLKTRSSEYKELLRKSSAGRPASGAHNQ